MPLDRLGAGLAGGASPDDMVDAIGVAIDDGVIAVVDWFLLKMQGRRCEWL